MFSFLTLKYIRKNTGNVKNAFKTSRIIDVSYDFIRRLQWRSYCG